MSSTVRIIPIINDSEDDVTKVMYSLQSTIVHLKLAVSNDTFQQDIAPSCLRSRIVQKYLMVFNPVNHSLATLLNQYYLYSLVLSLFVHTYSSDYADDREILLTRLIVWTNTDEISTQLTGNICTLFLAAKSTSKSNNSYLGWKTLKLKERPKKISAVS